MSRHRRSRSLAVNSLPLALAALLSLPTGGSLASAQTAPPPPGSAPGVPSQDVSELVNALLGGLMGDGPADGPALQKQVEDAGGIRFRRDVPVDFLNREQLGRYLRELFDDEYPKEQARADERLLRAFDLLPEGTDLRSVRARVLEENVAGFYDDRPGKRRLYAVSEDRTFTPMNQIVLAHEMRHALQDQYADLHALVSEGRSDFDDRQLAVLSLFEGDATLVMERFVRLRLGALGAVLGGGAGEGGEAGAGDAAGALAPGLMDVPGAPPVVRDQLVQPYLTGLAFARAVFSRGGPDALRDAWARPPASTEQVLHPELYFSREAPRRVAPRLAAPEAAHLVSEGTLGELLLRTLLEEGHDAAAAGWGGDGWRLWEARGGGALAWRSEWDTPGDAAEFHDALRARFTRGHGPAVTRDGWEVFGAPAKGAWAFAVKRDGDAVELASADEPALLDQLLRGARRAESWWPSSLDFGGGTARVPAAVAAEETQPERASREPAEGGLMATSTPPGNQTNLGMAPNLAGLLCYVPCCIGLVFSIVAAIVEKQSRFVRFHAFQSLILNGAALVVGIGLQVGSGVLTMAGLGMVVGLLVWLVAMVLGVGLLAVSVFLMIKANAGEEFELPVIGPIARNWV